MINVAFPLLSQSWGVDHERFVRLYRRGTEVLLGAMLLAPVLSMIVGPAGRSRPSTAPTTPRRPSRCASCRSRWC